MHVVLGEHTISQDPDRRGLAKAVWRTPSEIIMHEEWSLSRLKEGNDVALLRMHQAIPLWGPALGNTLRFSTVSPVCLPWNKKRSNFGQGRNDLTIVG